MSNPSALTAPLPPHPEFSEYYHGNAEKRAFLREVFDESAGDYDRVENLLALGSGRWYRRQALRRSGLREGMKVLDVATGTGLVAREAIGIAGEAGSVTGVDPSVGMLHEAQCLKKLKILVGAGEALPVGDREFDFLSMGYALRHLPDLRVVFAEFMRVLRPGGRVCILEITRPESRAGRFFLAGYFKLILPMLIRAVSRRQQTRTLWRYYWETIDLCVNPEIVLQALRDAGFTDVRHNRSLGLFSEYVATKP